MTTRIINFSGGESSALMTILEYNPETDIVIFADTGRETDATYRFINDFEAYEGIPVTRISFQNEFGQGFTARFRVLRKTTKRKDGKLLGYLPNAAQRICTGDLKIKPITRYVRNVLKLKKMDWLIGFRFDEKSRVKNYTCQKYKTPYFPLFEFGLTKKNVDTYWANKPYKLEQPSIMGNCDLCFLKGKNTIIKILTHYPELADKWIEDEERTGSTFIKGVKYADLLHIAKTQKQLFDLEDLHAEFSCSCTQ